MPKSQLNMYVEDELLEQLDLAARKYKRKSRATVATEIIESYIEFWVRAEDARAKILEAQKEMLGKDLAATSTKAPHRKKA